MLQALAVGRGLPDGLTFANPPLFKYLLLGEYTLVYGVLRVFSVTHSTTEFVDQFRADPSLLYLVARVTSAVFGALTVLAAAALGAQLGGTLHPPVEKRRIGLLAGGLTAVTFLLVRDSHFATNDALVALLVTTGLVFCARIASAASTRRDYALAGVLAGLAFSAKYYGIALLLPLVLAHLLARRGGGAGYSRGATAANLVLGLGACALAAVVTFPSLVTEPGRVLQDVYLHLYLQATGGYDGLDSAGGDVFYARTLALGLGWPLLLAAVAGSALSVGLLSARRPGSGSNPAALVVAVFAVAFIAVLGAERLYFARFLLPVLPALLVEAALALDWLFQRQVYVAFAATLVVATPTAIDAVRLDHLLTQTDTRTLASDWIATSLPSTTTIAVDAAPLGPSVRGDLGERAFVANADALFDLSPADYRARGIQYLVVSSFTLEAPAVDPTREARRQAFATALTTEATRIAQFRPVSGEAEPPFMYDQIYGPFNALKDLQRPGPTLSVYQLI